MPYKSTIPRVCEQCSAPFHASQRDIDKGWGRFCSKPCSHKGRVASILSHEWERFWSRVDKNGPVPTHLPELGPCWIWTGARCPKGYGRVGFRGKVRVTSVVAYMFAYGGLPDGKPIVSHLCDGGSTACVRPYHLIADTQAGNLAGMVSRERQCRGVRKPNARLNEDSVRYIRSAAMNGESHSAIAKRLSVSQSLITRVVSRDIWKHVA